MVHFIPASVTVLWKWQYLVK